jgi:formylglycine-generating enzyme required for sulfatase activity
MAIKAWFRRQLAFVLLLFGIYKISGLLLFTIILAVVFSFKGDRRKPVAGPPGTYWVSDTVFMDMVEVTNKEYRGFVNWMKKTYPDEPWIYKKQLPDTLVWRTYGTYQEDQVNSYFRSPAYNLFPVVGVTFEQAQDYCTWRTGRVREYLKKLKSEGKKTGLPENIADLHFRLPAVREWETAAYAGLDTARHPFGYRYLDDTLHADRVHVKKSYDQVVGMDYGGEPVNVTFGLPNGFGFYNLIGNVAEMTSAKGVAKGGSWKDYLDQCHVRDSTLYSAPSNWLGFRCVCVVTYKSGYDPVNGKKRKK